MKTCPLCGGVCTTERGQWHYVESGLDNVLLAGIEIRKCENCGNRAPVIPAVLQLHEALAQAIVLQPQRLRGCELRFLRQYLGLSKDDLADTMGVLPADVAAWEETANVTVQLERFLRLLAVAGRPADRYPAKGLAALGLDKLAQLGREPAMPRSQIQMSRPRRSHWQSTTGQSSFAFG